MFTSGNGHSVNHKCDSCGERFTIEDEIKLPLGAPKFLVIDRAKLITHNQDFKHNTNGLSYCAPCTKIVSKVLGI